MLREPPLTVCSMSVFTVLILSSCKKEIIRGRIIHIHPELYWLGSIYRLFVASGYYSPGAIFRG